MFTVCHGSAALSGRWSLGFQPKPHQHNGELWGPFLWWGVPRFLTNTCLGSPLCILGLRLCCAME